MIEYKDRTCVNCKFRELDCNIPPCIDCELLFKWEQRDED